MRIGRCLRYCGIPRLTPLRDLFYTPRIAYWQHHIPVPSLCIFLSFRWPVIEESLCTSVPYSGTMLTIPRPCPILLLVPQIAEPGEHPLPSLIFSERALLSYIKTRCHSKLLVLAHLSPGVPRHDVVPHVPEYPYAPEDRNQSKEQRKGCY